MKKHLVLFLFFPLIVVSQTDSLNWIEENYNWYEESLSLEENYKEGDTENGKGIIIWNIIYTPKWDFEIESIGYVAVGPYYPTKTTWEGIHTYDGEFKNEKKHGKGFDCTYSLSDGKRDRGALVHCYIGEFKDNNFHGKGRMVDFRTPYRLDQIDSLHGLKSNDILKIIINEPYYDGYMGENKAGIWENGEFVDSTERNNTKYAQSINVKDLERHLTILSSDSLEGRETGQKGQKMAADYIMNHFKNIGIPPYKKNTYYQKFKVENGRHTCKCDDCDLDFFQKLLGQDKYIKGENVLGYIEGSDLKEELIIITAHYDHLGKHEEKIYNGADDDGSGTVAAMEIAEAFTIAKKDRHGPRRSILVMCVSGEEKGLLGSAFYTDNPIYPLENTVANLNIDMIGRIDDWHLTTDKNGKTYENGNYVYLIGADMLSQELHDISEQINFEYTGLELDYTFNAEDDPNRYYYRSDHYNFAKNNIPVIFYFNGVHEDYHKVTDTIEKIDFNKIQTITRLVFLTAWELANRDERIQMNKIK